MPETATPIYEFVLRALQADPRWLNRQTMPQRLRSLEKPTQQLWIEMRNTTVDIDYAGDLCSAYAFKYFPPYAHAFYEILRESNLRPRQRHLRVFVLGAGPAPEAWAIERYLRDTNAAVESINFHLLDLRASSWSIVSDPLMAALATESPFRIASASHDIDLLDPNLHTELAELFPKVDVVVMQNVFNELPASSWPAFRTAFADAAAQLPTGAHLIISDLADHGSNHSRLSELQSDIGRHLAVARRVAGEPTPWDVGNYDTVPKIIQNALLDADPRRGPQERKWLVPRRWVKFDYFAAVGLTAAPASTPRPAPAPPRTSMPAAPPVAKPQTVKYPPYRPKPRPTPAKPKATPKPPEPPAPKPAPTPAVASATTAGATRSAKPSLSAATSPPATTQPAHGGWTARTWLAVALVAAIAIGVGIAAANTSSSTAPQVLPTPRTFPRQPIEPYVPPAPAPTPEPTNPPTPLVPPTQPPPRGNCDPSYPDVCIPSSPPDLDCGDIPERRFRVVGDDPHRFDGNRDGIACTS